jgi:hypothetical protein
MIMICMWFYDSFRCMLYDTKLLLEQIKSTVSQKSVSHQQNGKKKGKNGKKKAKRTNGKKKRQKDTFQQYHRYDI